MEYIIIILVAILIVLCMILISVRSMVTTTITSGNLYLEDDPYIVRSNIVGKYEDNFLEPWDVPQDQFYRYRAVLYSRDPESLKGLKYKNQGQTAFMTIPGMFTFNSGDTNTIEMFAKTVIEEFSNKNNSILFLNNFRFKYTREFCLTLGSEIFKLYPSINNGLPYIFMMVDDRTSTQAMYRVIIEGYIRNHREYKDCTELTPVVHRLYTSYKFVSTENLNEK